MKPIELFLSPAEQGGQTLNSGLSGKALSATGAAADDQLPKIFRHGGGDPNSLLDQGWAVIAPKGEDGDRMLALTKPLREQRAQDQQDEVPVYRVMPDMTASQSMNWLDRRFVGNEDDSDIPGYVLILGRPEQVSFAFQQVLSTECHVGRIGFAAAAHYEAYVDKLLRWERHPPHERARAVFFTARDGTSATALGHRLLMQPTIAELEPRVAQDAFPVGDIRVLAADDPMDAGSQLLDSAAMTEPSILFSCSHGLGAPLAGWASPTQQRTLQGALCLGGGVHLGADQVAQRRFLPGGLWFFFACFSAGTPSRSAYYHWLRQLQTLGEFGGDIDSVLAALPRADDRAFLAALPTMALANPDGPLAVIGHIDLAWSYSFQDLEKMANNQRHRRFRGLLREMARGSRVGVAFADLLRTRNLVKTDITIAMDEATHAQATAAMLLDEQARLGHRWMLHQDLDGYVLLGDPAARLAIRPRRHRSAAPATAANAPEIAPELPAGTAEPAGTSPTTGGTPIDPDTMVAAVHALIRGGKTADQVAEQYGVTAQTLNTWKKVYIDAGRRALAAHLRDAPTE